MVTPGAADGPDQVIAVPLVDSAAPAATEPVSVPVTVLAVVSVPDETVKGRARAGEVPASRTADKTARRRMQPSISRVSCRP
jgi:hypothetical protein